MDEELDDMPIVEDNSDISASEAIINAIQGYLEENSDDEDDENSSNEENNKGSDDGQHSDPSGNPVDEGQGKGKGNGNNQEDDSEENGETQGDDDSEDPGKDKKDEKKAEAKREAKEKERQNKIKQHTKKLKTDAKKKLIPKIAANYWNPASEIPIAIKESFKDTFNTIKDTSKKAVGNKLLKPQEKPEKAKEVATEITKTSLMQQAIELPARIARDLLKEAIKAASPYSWAVVAAVIVYLLYILLFIILVLIVLAIIVAISASQEVEYMSENYGVTSEYFYGIRTAYVNEDLLTESLELSYKQYVIDILKSIENTNGVSITIELPEISEDEPFTNDTPVDENITTLSLGIAKIAADKSPSDTISGFAELYPEIDYFGLTQDQVEDVNDFIDKYLSDNSIVNKGESELTISEMVDSAIESLPYIQNICQKVIIQDYIAEETGLEDVKELNYVGSVYMPHSNITISALSSVIATTTPEIPIEASCISRAEGTESSVASGTSNSDDGKILLDSVDNSTLTLSEFTSIDSSNLEVFCDGISLFEAIRLGAAEGKDYSIFFQKLVDDNNVEFYSWIPSDDNILYLSFNSTGNFIFSDLLLEVSMEETS